MFGRKKKKSAENDFFAPSPSYVNAWEMAMATSQVLGVPEREMKAMKKKPVNVPLSDLLEDLEQDEAAEQRIMNHLKNPTDPPTMNQMYQLITSTQSLPPSQLWGTATSSTSIRSF